MNRTVCVVALALFLSAPSLMAQAPKVSHIYPDAGINEQSITAHIYGDNLAVAPPSVKLIRTGHLGIDGTSINVVSQKYLTCLFDLALDSTGLYDVMVTNANGEDTLPRCFTIYSPPESSNMWAKTTVGYGGSSMAGVVVGDGDSDGLAEVYATNDDHKVYQFKWDGMGWSKSTLGVTGGQMRAVTVGDGNSDGEIEVYVTSNDNNLYQYKWNGAGWVESIVYSGSGNMVHVAVGDGNADGELEVYASNTDTRIYQFKWSGVAWLIDTVGYGYTVAVGDGNSDGVIEVYGSAFGSIFQFHWDGVGWTVDTVGTGAGNMTYLAVGDGNSDGIVEVYGANQDGEVYQFQWDGMNWAQMSIGSGGDYMTSVAVGDGNGDWDREVYATSGDWTIYQFRWTGSIWVKTVVGTARRYMSRVAVGDGNADGQMEVYATSSDSTLYQFKVSPAPNAVLSDTIHDFGAVPIGDSLDWKYLVISNAGAYTLYVDSLVSDTPDYVVPDPSFPDTILPSDSTLVTVRFKPSLEGEVPGSLWVYSSDPDEGRVYVILMGEGRLNEPDIALSDTIHDFGLVLLGDSLDWEYLVIKNTGIADLIVGGIISDTADYVVVSPSFPDTILPDDSTLVTVRFRPLSEGVIPGTLTVYSNDPDESPIHVGLTGEGYLTGIEEARAGARYFSFGLDSNPARGKVVFGLTVPEAGEITLQIYDAAGRLIDRPISGEVSPGTYEIRCTVEMSSGVYFYSLDSPWGTRTGKFVLIR